MTHADAEGLALLVTTLIIGTALVAVLMFWGKKIREREARQRQGRDS